KSACGTPRPTELSCSPSHAIICALDGSSGAWLTSRFHQLSGRRQTGECSVRSGDSSTSAETLPSLCTRSLGDGRSFGDVHAHTEKAQSSAKVDGLRALRFMTCNQITIGSAAQYIRSGWSEASPAAVEFVRPKNRNGSRV